MSSSDRGWLCRTRSVHLLHLNSNDDNDNIDGNDYNMTVSQQSENPGLQTQRSALIALPLCACVYDKPISQAKNTRKVLFTLLMSSSRSSFLIMYRYPRGTFIVAVNFPTNRPTNQPTNQPTEVCLLFSTDHTLVLFCFCQSIIVQLSMHQGRTTHFAAASSFTRFPDNQGDIVRPALTTAVHTIRTHCKPTHVPAGR